jgi:hypothetical protein
MRNRRICRSIALMGLFLFLPVKSLAQSTITCNSDDERRHSCSVDTRGAVHLIRQHSDSACTEGYSWGSDGQGVRLLTQHSGSPCTEGRSWGSDGQGIWVDHGCRADFSVGGNTDYRDENRHDRDGSNRESQTFSCNSDDMRKHSCAVKTDGGTVRLVAQHSDAPCTKDYSWGTNRHGVWVNHGCRADFAVIAKYRRDSYR